jgi:hypothetical protein
VCGKKLQVNDQVKNIHPPYLIKKLLKSKVNPAEIKVGITSLKSLRDGKVMIETSNENEIVTLWDKIGEKCGELDGTIYTYIGTYKETYILTYINISTYIRNT